jgi:hypothetical protein
MSLKELALRPFLDEWSTECEQRRRGSEGGRKVDTTMYGDSSAESRHYVLIKVSADGTPVSVQTAPCLAKAREQLQTLNAEEGGWHIFDLRENRVVEP